ncbi:MAG: transporter substrate-binding domain-containing protein, partial [Isosphaeraceae bacterium]|nr:transporter substrate-binding domain-containing protein [Isosphaeraceae bacterium]
TIMSSSERFLLLLALCTTLPALAAEPPAKAGGAPKVLTVCAIPASMPRMDKDADGAPRGLDVALAQRLGQALGRPVEFHWCANTDCAWHCLPAGRCDVVLGQPENSSPPHAAAWSVPYARSQFGLVVRRDGKRVRSFDDLRGKRVGIVTGTVAIAEKDHAVTRFKTRGELLDGFDKAGLEAAFLDADFAAWYLHGHEGLQLRLVPDFAPRERWNMALAVRPQDASLLVEINRSLAQLAESGALEKIYAEYGVPFRPPFAGETKRQPPPSTWRRIRERGELVVSFDPANLPYSSAKDDRPGCDVALARALAQRLGVKLRIQWLDVRRETAMGALLQGDGDLVMGTPVDPRAVEDDEELAAKVLYSRPYSATGYLLIHRKGESGPRSLADLLKDKALRVGTEAGSVADYSLRQRGHLRRLYRNQLATLKALTDRDIDYAYLWANAVWVLKNSPEFPLEVVPGYEPEDRWNVAVAMRRDDQELKEHVDEALQSLTADGTVAGTLAEFHVPDFAPSVRGEPPVKHPVIDRGREPQLQRVQTSKNPYTALARIRAAGELVVGLDQNNLPFSKAHPEPSGLDLEVARLLAEKLGVSLRVYWAYSTHDSYPSKLTSKQLCDVILGVAPDDRFSQRVLFSRPYYVARYEWVVRTGDGPPGDQDAVAVEEGVAVRGLRGRPTRAYPSTEAVLEAVATGRAKAGYVISTRGSWLAAKQWDGKLAFLPAQGSPDAFPIGAAVRKSDRDLKEAIDRAWEELDRSGRLAEVFDRWHVRYHPASPTDADQQ